MKLIDSEHSKQRRHLYQKSLSVTPQLKNITLLYMNRNVRFVVCGITETFSGESHAYITLASGCALVGRPPSFGVSRGLKGPPTFHDIRAGSAIPTKASPRQDTMNVLRKGGAPAALAKPYPNTDDKRAAAARAAAEALFRSKSVNEGRARFERGRRSRVLSAEPRPQ
jgi:hypothetical protein